MTADQLAELLIVEFERIAAELAETGGVTYQVALVRPSTSRFGMEDPVGVTIADGDDFRRLTFWPQDDLLTWIEFREGERSTHSENRTDYARSTDPTYLRQETEVVAALMTGRYTVRRVGLLRRKALVVPTSTATWYLRCEW